MSEPARLTATQPETPLVGTATRPHPARLAVTTYPLQDTVAARYGDMDANGHLNNLALESIHENARARMNAQVLPGIYDPSVRHLRLVSATNVVHFLREAHWPNMIRTGTGVGRLGRTSFVASSALFIGDACISLCDTVLVMLDDDGPTPIPDEARARLDALLLTP